MSGRPFKTGDKARLLADRDGIAAGMVGVVIGFLRHTRPSQVVLAIDGRSLRVGPESLEPVKDETVPPA